MDASALRRIVGHDTHVHLLADESSHRVGAAHRELLGPAFTEHYLAGTDFDPFGRSVLEAWEALRDRVSGRTRYNCPVRFLNALRHAEPAEPRPLAVVLKRDDKAVAAIAGFHDRAPVVGHAGRLTMGLPRVDALSVLQTALIKDDSPATTEQVAAYLKAILHEGIFERLDLANVRVDDPMFTELCDPSGLSDRMICSDKVRWIRRLTDPQTGEHLKHESSKTRSRLRGKRNTLAKQFGGELDMVVVTDPAETDDFVRKAAAIVKQTYQAPLGVGIEDSEEDRSFAKEMATDGVFRGYLLIGAGEPISYVAGDLQDGVFDLWATSFLPQWHKFSPGIILLTLVMDDLVTAGARVFDFGEGEAKYKEMMGSDRLEERDFRAYGHSLSSRAAHACDLGLVKLRTRGRDLLLSTGMLDRARKEWRRVLQRIGA